MTSFPPRTARHLALVRADAIGDHLLASSLLGPLRRLFPEAMVTVIGPPFLRDLLQGCPHVDRIMAIDKQRLHKDLLYRFRVRGQVRDLGADWAINTVYSRDSASDLLTLWTKAGTILGHHGDTNNLRPRKKLRNDRGYSKLLEDGPGDSTELDRHRTLLKCLGWDGDLSLQVWTRPEDEQFANTLFQELGLQGGNPLAFFPGTGHRIRTYPGYAEALRAFVSRNPATVLALGSAEDAGAAASILDGLPSAHNLCGKTSLLQAAAILRRCRLAFGGETGLALLASCVGTTLLALVGGGHFGRFLPAAPQTAILSLPLACFGCNWSCPYPVPHCIQGMPADRVAEILETCWSDPPRRPRLYTLKPPPSREGDFPDAHQALLFPREVEVTALV